MKSRVKPMRVSTCAPGLADRRQPLRRRQTPIAKSRTASAARVAPGRCPKTLAPLRGRRCGRGVGGGASSGARAATCRSRPRGASPSAQAAVTRPDIWCVHHYWAVIKLEPGPQPQARVGGEDARRADALIHPAARHRPRRPRSTGYRPSPSRAPSTKPRRVATRRVPRGDVPILAPRAERSRPRRAGARPLQKDAALFAGAASRGRGTPPFVQGRRLFEKDAVFFAGAAARGTREPALLKRAAPFLSGRRAASPGCAPGPAEGSRRI